jgi:MFS family permease
MLLAPIGGAISDRFNRRLLMVLYDAACCVIALLFLFVMLSGYASVPAVGVVMVLLGIVGAMETPNGTACLPLLVEQSKLETSNGLIQAVQSISGIVAPVLGGILYGALGITALVAISGAAFGLAAFTEMFIQIPYIKRPHEGSIIKTLSSDLIHGFRYVWKEPFIRKLGIVAALLNMALAPCFLVGSPIVFRVTMQGGDFAYGLGMGLINAASILGALTVGVFSKRMRTNNLWQWILGIAILFIPLAFSITPLVLNTGFLPSFALYMLCLILMVAATTILSIFVIVRIQAETPGENLGKVMAIIQAVAQCAAPIGQLMYGFAFEGFKDAAYIPLLIAGTLTALIAFIGKIMLQNEAFRKESEGV